MFRALKQVSRLVTPSHDPYICYIDSGVPYVSSQPHVTPCNTYVTLVPTESAVHNWVTVMHSRHVPTCPLHPVCSQAQANVKNKHLGHVVQVRHRNQGGIFHQKAFMHTAGSFGASAQVEILVDGMITCEHVPLRVR